MESRIYLKAIILCAGYGTRMKPYTETYQKTMIPIHGKPLLEYLIEGIKLTGFKDFIIVVGYNKEQIIDYFQEGKKWEINIEYIEQHNLNGTGGALLLCENSIIDQHFFLTWGDTLVGYDVYREVYEVFKKENPDFILVTNYVDDPYKGAAVYCEGNYCSSIIEKPSKGTSTTNLNNAGVFILSREIFSVLKKLHPSKRGEIEVPDAIQFGMKERGWKFRVVRIKRDQFYGDFGDFKKYEEFSTNSSWLNLL
ncbi:MAG: nucleotidyltransferase family protein [Candidatus Hodarchaeota archaeon]